MTGISLGGHRLIPAAGGDIHQDPLNAEQFAFVQS
jgi:hypothetical protein